MSEERGRDEHYPYLSIDLDERYLKTCLPIQDLIHIRMVGNLTLMPLAHENILTNVACPHQHVLATWLSCRPIARASLSILKSFALLHAEMRYPFGPVSAALCWKAPRLLASL